MDQRQKKIKILVADDEYDFCATIKQHINTQNDFECVGIACDGLRAKELIEQLNPDVVLLDYIMPLSDGINVLEYISKNTYKPNVIISTSFVNSEITQKFLQFGVSDIIQKPFNISNLFSKIRALSTSKKVEYSPFNCEIPTLLTSLGVPAKLIGYNYLCSAIDYTVLKWPTRPHFKEIYERIAQMHNTDFKCVEYSINSALLQCVKRNEPLLTELKKTNNINKFTNGNFILSVAKLILY